MAKNEANSKKTEELIEKFTNLENKLVELLGSSSIDVEEKITRASLKKKLSNYIKNVEELKALFEEYEKIAVEIENLTTKKIEGEKLSKAVVDLREEEKIEDFAETYANEIVVSSKGEVTVSKKKKKSAAREL